MVNTTATQNIRKPESTDDPKQLAAYFLQTATDMDRRMAAHFYDLDRAVNPPFAVVRLSAPITVDANVMATGAPYFGTVPFDTIDADTNGMADLSVNAYQISLNETGYWWIGGYARLSGFVPGASNSDVIATARVAGSTFQDARHDDGSVNPGSGLSGMVPVLTLATPVYAALTVEWAGASTTSVTTVFQAELWALKVRDL
jgi:hypothetical protein